MGSTVENKLKDIIVKTLENHIDLMKCGNSTYSDSQEFLVWSWAGVNQVSVHEASHNLRVHKFSQPSFF